MKKIALLSLSIIVSLSFFGCKETPKQEENTQTLDTISVEKVTIDTLTVNPTTTIEETKEVVTVVKEVKAAPIVVKKTEPPKTTVKEVVTKTTVTKKEVVVEEIVKKEVPVEKVIEVKKEVEVIVEKPKEIASSSNWIVPAKDKALKNPVEASKENLKEAKVLYDMHCKSCHGTRGLGDGTKAKSMKGDLGDFSSATFHTQTDGELFYKTKVGRADMPGYAKKLSDEDIWLTVHYMRSLKK